MAGKRKYYDLRYLFMRGLQAHEQMQRGKHYLKSAAECTSKAIVSLELSEKNINTAKQAVRLESIGPETVRRLEGYVNTQVYSSDRPALGRFVSSAGAILVALLNLTELAAADSQGGVALIPEEELQSEAAKLCDERFLPAQSSGFCQAWWRLEVLIKRDLVKRRSLHKANVYHLLPLGMEKALSLRERSLGNEPTVAGVKNIPSASATSSSSSPVTKPAKPRKQKAVKENSSSEKGGTCITSPKSTAVSSSSTSFVPSSTSTSSTVNIPPVKHVLTDAMYSNDKGQDGVILLVDIQECGGNRTGLADLCEMIEQTGTMYRTRKLPCADYNWLWRCDGVERQLPFLLERKRADDVAFSLKDGRFWGQIDKMVSQKEEFQKKGVQATLQYIIEGKPESFVVRCADGCQGIGRCGNPSLQQVQRVLCDLKHHPHLEVVAMDSMLGTVRHLADTTSKLRDRAERGEFDALIIAEMTAASTAEPCCIDEAKMEPIIIDDHDENSNEPTLCQNKTCNTEYRLGKPMPEQKFKGSHSSFSLFEGCDELPPLVLTPSSKRGRPDVNKENGSVGHVVEQPCGGSPAPLTTASGSPRGRVYLMKRKAGKFGDQISPNKKALISEDDNPAVTGTNAAAGKEHHTDGHTAIGISIGEREIPQHSATHSRPRHSACEHHQPHRERSESLSVFSVRDELWEGSRQSQWSPNPFVCPASSSKPSASDNLSSGLPGSDSHVSPVGATSRQILCHCDTDVKEGSFSNDSLADSSCVHLMQEGKEHLVTVKSASIVFHNEENARDKSTVSTEEQFSYSITYPLLDPVSHSEDKPEMANIKPEKFFPEVSSQRGEKDDVCTSYVGQDGSDSDSLPDIDLSMGLSGQPSHTISSSASLLHVPAPGEGEEEGQITSWPGGSNSQKKKSEAAPSPPQTANTHVQPADKIAQIAVVFPQMRGSQIAEVLRRFDGDVERCVIGILEDPELVWA